MNALKVYFQYPRKNKNSSLLLSRKTESSRYEVCILLTVQNYAVCICYLLSPHREKVCLGKISESFQDFYSVGLICRPGFEDPKLNCQNYSNDQNTLLAPGFFPVLSAEG